jgi:hypothetical protein
MAHAENGLGFLELGRLLSDRTGHILAEKTMMQFGDDTTTHDLARELERLRASNAELLAALAKIEDETERTCRQCRMIEGIARAAIAKAEGK